MRNAVPGTVVSILLAALELSHPTWSAGAVAQAVLAAGAWWLVLHVLLMAGYAVLVWLLWVPAALRLPRVLLLVFLACNTAFLGLDGLGVGLLARADPSAADQLWNSPMVGALANLTGAAWAASLLGVAASLAPLGRTRLVVLGLSLTWLTFVARALPIGWPASPLLPPGLAALALPAGLLGLASRTAAIATGAWVVYATGIEGLSFAVLVFAAVLQQHVGAEAGLGLLCVGFAMARRPQSA